MSLNASYNLKVFDSLKCALCKAPFARFENLHLSPRKLGCGLAMCNGCFEREKAARNHRKHRCDHENCFHNTKPAYFLIDILLQNSLKLSTRLDGYYLVKPFNIPSCPYCGDKYCNEIAGKKSFVLNCNHMICTECYQSREKKWAKKNEWKFTIECPTCGFVTKSDVYMRKDRFQSFLFELPEMNSQFDRMRAASYGRCDDRFKLGTDVCPCTKLSISDTNQRYCEEAEKALAKIQQSALNAIQAGKASFQNLYREFFEPLEGKMLLNMQNSGNCTLEELKEKQQKTLQLIHYYNKINEEHACHLQIYEAEIRELSQMLDE